MHVFIALDSLGTFHHGIIGDIGSVPGVLPRAVLGGGTAGDTGVLLCVIRGLVIGVGLGGIRFGTESCTRACTRGGTSSGTLDGF